MKKIRLLTISATCERGGSDMNLLRLLRSLDKNEYEILHLIPYPGPLADEFRNAGVRVEALDMPRLRIFKNPLRYMVFLLRFLPVVFKIREIICREQIDIVCTSSMVNLYAALAAKLAQRPHILITGEYLFILKLFSPYFYFFSEKVVCCSRLVATMFPGGNKVAVVYPGISLDEFSPGRDGSAIRAELGVTGSLISMVTRLAPWKGVEVFIKAAQYIDRDVKFVVIAEPVIGKEKYALKLEKMIKRLGLESRVMIRSEKYKHIPDILAASDIVVHASLRPEPFGLIIIEAMAAGRPVIASSSGGPLEIITGDRDGLLIKPGNPRTLALAISGLLDDPQARKNMAVNAAAKAAEKFDLKGYVRSLDRIFKDALKGHSLPLDIDKDTVKKILVIQLFGMGDLICSLPALDALRKHFNRSAFTLLMDAKLSELAGIMGCSEIIGYKRGICSKSALLARVRRGKFDMAVIFNPLFQGACIAYLSGAKYRIGYSRDYEGRQNIEKISRLLTHPLSPLDKPMHDVQRYCGIVGALNIEAECVFPGLNLPPSAIKWADAFLRDNGISQNDFILGVNPNAAWESRCWPTDRFAAVADAMSERRNTKVIFFGSSGPTDTRRIAMINSLLKHKAVSAAGKTGIAGSAALLGRCNLFLTNDSGPMHLAAALGVDMLALFGPGDIKKFGYERKNIVNITAAGPSCKPCVLNYRYKDACPDNLCMKNITVSEVIAAIEALLRR